MPSRRVRLCPRRRTFEQSLLTLYLAIPISFPGTLNTMRVGRGGWFGRRNARVSESVPEGFATKCEKCSAILFARDFERNFKVCSKCGFHHRMNVAERLEITVDEGSFVEMDSRLSSKDPLNFPEYKEKLKKAKLAAGRDDAIVTGSATIDGHAVIIGVAAFAFVGGS